MGQAGAEPEGDEGEIEIRQVFEAEDFGPELAAEVAEVFDRERRSGKPRSSSMQSHGG